MDLVDRFSKVATKISDIMGHPTAFICAAVLIVGWAITGNSFNWSQSHSLFINTVTTIITFLLGFLILNTANRVGKAEQLKLDELIRAINEANNRFIKLETKGIKELKKEEQIMKEITSLEDNSE